MNSENTICEENRRKRRERYMSSSFANEITLWKKCRWNTVRKYICIVFLQY